jgi:uncharacterized protein YqeY
MTLIEQINEGIKQAMRAKNEVRLSVLRMLKSKILAVDARAQLPDPEVIKLFKTYFGNLQEAFDQAKSVSRMDIADRLEQEIAVVQEFLPKEPSLEETRKLVVQAIQEVGAQHKKELGIAMKKVLQLNPAVNGKIAKDLILALLAD